MKSYHNLKDDLRFRLTRSDIVRIERYEMNQATFSHFNLPFIRIHSRVGTLHDLLICAGGNRMSTIEAETRKLEVVLRAFVKVGEC